VQSVKDPWVSKPEGAVREAVKAQEQVLGYDGDRFPVWNIGWPSFSSKRK
jgi:hypothetical protein